MMQSHVGEWAALGTALCWTVSALSFEQAGRRIGSLTTNGVRLVLALLFLGVYSLVFRGHFFPVDAPRSAWIWLSLSGFVGFFLGDLFLFRAFVLVGSRVAMLIMALAPLLTALLGWVFLHETLALRDTFAMAITLTGIGMVILVKSSETHKIRFSHPVEGILFAFGGALGQAGGMVLSKRGVTGYDPFAATQIRVFAGLLGFVLLYTVTRRWSRVGEGIRHPAGMKYTVLGAFFGPFLGVSLSLFSIQHTLTGITATLIALVPVFLIPPSVVLYHERVRVKEVLGALVAVWGAALFFMGR